MWVAAFYKTLNFSYLPSFSKKGRGEYWISENDVAQPKVPANSKGSLKSG